MAMSNKHVTNTTTKESSIYAALQFSNSYLRDNYYELQTLANTMFAGVFL